MSIEIKELTQKQELDNLYEQSALTFEGCTMDEDNLKVLKGWLKAKNIKNMPSLNEVYLIKGKTMNEIYGLTMFNAYPNDLNIVAVDNKYVDQEGIAIKRFELGGRWFTDIVDNNARREEIINGGQSNGIE